MSVSAGVVRSRVSRQAGVSQRMHNKRPLKASPMEQAGSGSRKHGLVGPLLRRAAFQGTKGRKKGAGQATRERQAHLSRAQSAVPLSAASPGQQHVGGVRVCGPWPRHTVLPGRETQARALTRTAIFLLPFPNKITRAPGVTRP